MPHRLAACAGLIVLLLALPAAAQAADVVRPSSVSGATTVPADGARTLALRCASPTAVALHAAVTRSGRGISVLGSVPGTDAGSWRFRVRNAAAAGRRVSAVLRCVHLEAPSGMTGVSLTVATRRPPRVSIPGGGTAALAPRCPSGFVATGYGLARSRAGEVRVAEALPSARGWGFTLENTGERAGAGRLHVRCLRRAVSGTRGGARSTLRFRFSRPAFENRVGSGSQRFSHSCARRQFAVAGGFSVDPADDIVLTRSFPVRDRSAVWSFRQRAGSQEVDSSLVCLRRGSRFE